MQLGGGVPAVMIHLKRLGVPVQFSTFLGRDRFSRFARTQLKKAGVTFQNLYHGSGMPVNVTSVAITPNDRTFLSYRDEVVITDAIKEKYTNSSAAQVSFGCTMHCMTYMQN